MFNYIEIFKILFYFMNRIKPSSTCGPFRNLTRMFESMQWTKSLETSNSFLFWLRWAYNSLIENPLFLFLITGVLLWVSAIQKRWLSLQKVISSFSLLAFNRWGFAYCAVLQIYDLFSNSSGWWSKESHPSVGKANWKCKCSFLTPF